MMFECGDPGNRPLAAHGVNTDEEAFQVQGIEQFGNGRDLVALRRHFLLTKYQTQPGRKGADHVNGRFAAVAGTAHGFAVDRDGATQIRDDAAHPPAEAAFELLRVEQAEDPQKGVFRRNAVLEHQKLAQPAGMRTRPGGHVFNRVAVGKDRRDRHHQQFQEVMPGAIARLARVVHIAQHLHQDHSSRHLLRCPKNESRRDFLRVYKCLS